MKTLAAHIHSSAARHLLIILGVTGLFLLAPLVAMQFTTQVTWTAYDFAAAAILLTGTALLFMLALRAFPTRRGRIGAGVALACGMLLVWAELAVGIVGA
jgi:hypothetical protein